MGIRIIVTKDNNELYLELNIFYNIVILILGILALFLNGIYCYVIFKEKLWTQSIQYVLNMFISFSGILLGLRHIVVSIVNLTMFDSAIFSYDVPLCKVKSSFDVLILYFFETSFGLRTTFFTILIGLPILYKNYVENVRNNKYIAITITSFSLIYPHETSYNPFLCKVRSSSEIFLLYFFESTFGTRVTIFVIMLNYPVLYRNTIDSNKKGKFVNIPIIIVAILATAFFTFDSLSIKAYGFCSFYSSFGPTYEKFFIALIGAVVILTVPVVYLGSTAIKKFKTEGKYKNSVIQLLNYEITVFLICWFLPNMCIFVCYFIRIKSDQMGMLYDISSLTLTISGIVEFPFTLWKNRDVKICFYKIFGAKTTVIIGGGIEMKNFKIAKSIPKHPTCNKLFNVKKY
uniref:G_PROTEIN_RECEP_F1_2 domain-containing protein n=1 Tax=Strongyloides papillosus TaxID=174720 RepID=A0A0N5BDA7_STREA